jgi:AcrR family transcriptional regulator
VSDHRSRPRRRGAALEDAIVDAAIEELREVGYARMTMDSVARRAGAGKASVYRRWPSRVELALEAADRLIGDPPLPPEPASLREDLLALLRYIAEQGAGPVGETFRGVASECLGRTDVAEVAELSRSRSLHQLREVVRRAVERGERVDPDPPPLRLQVPAAMLQHRILVHGPPIDDAFVVALVDQVAVPLLAGPPSRA